MRGVSYEHICGQAKAYQKGQTDAFNAQRNAIKPSIDSVMSMVFPSLWDYRVNMCGPMQLA